MTPMLIDGKPWGSATGDVPGPGSATVPRSSSSNSGSSLLDELLSGGPDRAAASATMPRSTSSNSGFAPAGSATVQRPAWGSGSATVQRPFAPAGSATVRVPQPESSLLDNIMSGATAIRLPGETAVTNANPYAIASPPPPASLRFLNRNRPPQGGKSGRGRGCSRGGRRGKRVVKSASRKRCRRKGKRSRKAHS
jgi:hypothetical protein